jgi:hypothetical protein
MNFINQDSQTELFYKVQARCPENHNEVYNILAAKFQPEYLSNGDLLLNAINEANVWIKQNSSEDRTTPSQSPVCQPRISKPPSTTYPQAPQFSVGPSAYPQAFRPQAPQQPAYQYVYYQQPMYVQPRPVAYYYAYPH